MTVHVGQRKTSPHEFIHTYKVLRAVLTQWMNSVPKRKKKYACTPIEDNIYATMETLVRIDEQVYKPNTRNNIEFARSVQEAINLVSALPSCMTAYCLICYREPEKLIRIEEMINKELSLLEGIMKTMNKEYRTVRVKMYSHQTVMRCKFLSKLRELVLLTHQKIPYVPNRYDYTIKNPAVNLSVRAFRYAYDANSIYPEKRSDIDQRKVLFEDSLACLVQYEDHIATLFLLSDYDNDLMDRWAFLLVECQKLIRATMKSDRERYKKLG